MEEVKDSTSSSFELELSQFLKAKGCNLVGAQVYPYPSHVNASSFVSIKLSGETNFALWKDQMMCLVESHGMLGFVDGSLKNPMEIADNHESSKKKAKSKKAKEAHDNYEEWKRSDRLVKGWILGSLTEHVMGLVVGLNSAHDVCKKLYATYNHPDATSSAPKAEAQLYPYPSHVNASSFISMKLSGKTNYVGWKEQMTCLFESHDMLGFIDGKLKNPKEIPKEKAEKEGIKESSYGEWKRSDALVKGWILGSLNEDVVVTVVGLHTAYDVWKKLNTAYNPPKVTPAPPKPTPTTPEKAEAQLYPYPSHVNASSFISMKLSGKTNYVGWKEQMTCLFESHDMLGFIDGKLKNPKEIPKEKAEKEGIKESSYGEWKRSDALVKGWILGSLNEDVVVTVVGLHTAYDVWKKLNTAYNPPKVTPAPPKPTPTTPEKAEAQLYPYPSHVNASSFISMKLSGKTNYVGWKEQMTCLFESHDMLGFIDGKLKNPKEIPKEKAEKEGIKESSYGEWKRSDALVKGWILGSLNEDVVVTVVGLHTAYDVWKKLNTAYNPPKVTPAPPKPTPTTPEKDAAEYIPLYRASLMGDWEKAEEIFSKDPNAVTAKVNGDGNSALHLAIGIGSPGIQYLKNLLEKINPEILPTIINNREYTTLDYSAMVGNTEAAMILVNKNPRMLYMVDNDKYLPVQRAIFVPHVATFRYLLKASREHIALSNVEGHYSPFEGIKGVVLLTNVIIAGLFDVALELIKDYPELARTKNGNMHSPLTCIAKKMDAYYSGTRYNFFRRWIYFYVPTENNYNLSNIEKAQDIESKGNKDATTSLLRLRSCFHTVIQRLYLKLWNIALLRVSCVKEVQEDKAKHNRALALIKCICYEVRTLNKQTDLRYHCITATNLAIMNNSHEALEEIIESFPQAIWWNKDDTYLIQLAIINRCEKVYNMLVHQTSDHQYFHKILKDKNQNNLMHLAGRLAPTHRLNLVSGAALQMQRELQWFQEVERFALPKHKDAKNSKDETPMMVFRREHEDLRKEGEEWMKKTADSYTITAALIIIVVFAAAITVLGGNNGDTGKAIFIENDSERGAFIIFAIADAISLFTSTTSLLLFLSILTARYAEQDFLHSLPKRLIIGLTMLFMSMTSMIIAFSETLLLMFGQGKGWILIPIAALTCLPIASFVTLQFSLLVELISSTYGRGIFGKQSDRRIY